MGEQDEAAAGVLWTDAQLIEVCLDGDQGASAALVDKYKNLIYSIPVRWGFSQDDATDVFQSVSAQLLTDLCRLREPEALPAWLIQVTWRRCNQLWKERLRDDQLVDGRLVMAARGRRRDPDEGPPGIGLCFVCPDASSLESSAGDVRRIGCSQPAGARSSVRNHANVLNMSFSFASPSNEMRLAVINANLNGAVCVAAAGNDGLRTMVYPAGYSNQVMGVASTSNSDTRSTFSNYGQNLVWVAAPGEGVVTLYPFGTYAATWGTSFSTPFVAGTAALLREIAGADEWHAAGAIAHAKYINSDLGNGRLDVYQAVLAWRQWLGLL